MAKEITIGVIAALLASLITWFSIGFKDNLSKIELQKVAAEIKNDDDFFKVLIDEFIKDGRFKGNDGEGIGNVVQQGANSCMEIGRIHQICWGSEKLDRPPNDPHVRLFNFKFAKKFTDVPVVTTGVHSNYPKTGDAFGVYHYTLSKENYVGAVIEFEKNESPSPVLMQYFAVGKKMKGDSKSITGN
ncbi:MAG: hypothetical protein ACRBCI_07165 [Cellvibrionaceae bacterium]